jgi:hypothetical protein
MCAICRNDFCDRQTGCGHGYRNFGGGSKFEQQSLLGQSLWRYWGGSWHGAWFARERFVAFLDNHALHPSDNGNFSFAAFPKGNGSARGRGDSLNRAASALVVT